MPIELYLIAVAIPSAFGGYMIGRMHGIKHGADIVLRAHELVMGRPTKGKDDD